MTLFPALSAPLTAADKTAEGVVVRRGGKAWRCRGRAADGRWILAVCDQYGSDDKQAALTWLPADDAWMVAFLAGIARARVGR